jgi:hypothetical protein
LVDSTSLSFLPRNLLHLELRGVNLPIWIEYTILILVQETHVQRGGDMEGIYEQNKKIKKKKKKKVSEKCFILKQEKQKERKKEREMQI